ncbi:hypothetical protein BDF20DRAFT_850377 [Mycotypha africana]|uniref:uncharacterized protein n=1 Tax=Mycotypha africana TaxID=64632 RepID=UPI0023016806|nr:uncharacterized protein BDF20DRAFT_850377 [Mycotypha africana]KAI8987457.1 hypothetical protein BDF20DRAFT_850377 [Mycotypha africana]
MISGIRNKLKSATPSIRSSKSISDDIELPETKSFSTSSTSNGPAPPPPIHTVHRPTDTLPANLSRNSSGSIQSLSSGARSSYQSGDSQHEASSPASSATSLSMPPTPPSFMGGSSTGRKYHHMRYPSNASLSLSMNSEIFMNHNHLKPGDNAELLSYDKTINLYRENAKRSNDPNIQCDLAIYLYESSKNNNKKPEEKKAYMHEAVKMLKNLAVHGHAESQYYLANIYASGATHKSGKPDFGNAFPLFVQAAKRQHADAAYRAAKCHEDGLGCFKNKSKAIQYYKLAATLNHPGAMYRLGLAAIHGSLGLQRNVKDGNKWLKRAAAAATPEYPHALHELGLLHEKGLGNIIFKDIGYSVQLYSKAAELGYAPSAYRLGQCYEFGYLNCQKDSAASVYYYTIAARQGNDDACLALSAWYLTGDEPHVIASEEKAYFWAEIAARKGVAKAQFAMGYFAEAGVGRSKDLKEAMEWYKKASSQGDDQARKRLNHIVHSMNEPSSSATSSTSNQNMNIPTSTSHVNHTATIPSSLLAGEAR